MDIDAQAKYIYRLIEFETYARPILSRCEEIIAAYDARQALVADDEVDDTPKTDGSGTTDGVEGNTEEPAVGGTTETLPLETVAEDAPKTEVETVDVEEKPAEPVATEETATEPEPVAEEPVSSTETPAADAPVEEPVVQEEQVAETEEPKPAA